VRESTPAEKDARVKKKIISWRHITLTYCSMLLLVGVQVGIIVFPGFMSIHAVIQVAIELLGGNRSHIYSHNELADKRRL